MTVKQNSSHSSLLLDRSMRSVWHPCTQMQHHEQLPLVALAGGKGAWLYDQDGKRYLDAISSWWTNLFGHTNEKINAAICDQLKKLEHAMLAGFTHEPVVALSERLCALTGNALGHCFYASDGASAVEIALKMSFHAWKNRGVPKKEEFVCLKGSYHGETIGALSVTDVPLFRDSYGPLLRNVHIVMSPDARQAKQGQSASEIAIEAAYELEKLFEKHADHIAALIIEPLVQCATGFAMHDPLYLEKIRDLCNRYQVHLIADEIAVGCGRTGTFFACEQVGIWPDFMCLSKGITGGYLPLSLVMTTDEIYDLFYSENVAQGFLHSHSYTGNPLACRAALATLDIFRDDDILNRNKLQAQLITDTIKPLMTQDNIKNFRQCGMIWAFDVIVRDPEKSADFARLFFAEALKNELLLRPIGNTVYVMPPYILQEEEINQLASGLQSTLKKALKQ